MKKLVLLRLIGVIFLFLLTVKVSAQANVGIGTVNPDPSAILDIAATDKGLLIPRLNCSQMFAISSPANGLIVYNTDSLCFFYFQSTSWVSLCSNTTIGPIGPTGPQGIQGIIGPTGLQGATGIQGAMGPTGTNGIDGINGINGVTGPTGVIGATGPTGNGSSYASGITTYNVATPSGTQIIPHGLGIIPKKVKLTGVMVPNTPVSQMCNGVFDASGNRAVSLILFEGSSPAIIDGAYSSTTKAIGFSNDAANNPFSTTNCTNGIITVDAINITITWTKNGNPIGTAYIMWETQD